LFRASIRIGELEFGIREHNGYARQMLVHW
jgi:hypothetical protein